MEPAKNQTHQHHLHGRHHHNFHSNHSRSHNHLHRRHNAVISFSSIVIIIVSIITIVVLLAILLIIIMLKRIRCPKNNAWSFQESGNVSNSSGCLFLSHNSIDFNSSPEVKGGCFYGGNIRRVPSRRLNGVQVFTYKELDVATDKFSESNVIGNSGFGVIYRGVLSDGTIAAIKKLHREGKQGERAFRIEVDLLSRFYSPYLVELLGYCADQHHRLLIFEHMPNGTLHNYLHHHNDELPPLDWSIRLMIALDCAKALEFLHEYATPPIIHRDFKSSNILLDHNFRAKVSDFGLAKMGSDKINGQMSTRVLGTTGYLAPEYAATGTLTTKSDVYSYGVVLLELLTGRVPVDPKRPPGEHVLVSWNISLLQASGNICICDIFCLKALPRLTNKEKVMEMLDPALEGKHSTKDLVQIAAIAAVCVQPEADYRPLMTDVVQSLIPLAKNLSSLSCSGSSRFQYIRRTPSVGENFELASYQQMKQREKV
ncbi:hypothetical protein ACFE04_007909 [Oxalis oulophora]